MESQLQVRDLSHTYQDARGRSIHVDVLERLSFELGVGEFLVVVGPSGCGKTTLLNLIASFIPRQSGEVLINGTQKKKPSSDCVLISQEQTLFSWKTALDNVAFGLKAKGLSRAEQVATAMEYLQLVNLADFAWQYPKQLSGGMKQRLALARALTVEPKLILMDEPFASLDWQSRLKLQEELLRICMATKQTVLMATHDIGEAVYLADRVMVLTKRPAKIAELIAVPLSRPRTPDQRYTAEFLAIVQHLLTVLNS